MNFRPKEACFFRAVFRYLRIITIKKANRMKRFAF